MKILFILHCPFFLFASDYPHFTQNNLLSIENKHGIIAKNRALDYQNKINIFDSYNRTKQVNIVNLYLNQLLPQYDNVIQNQEDYWASPKEFLNIGYGDCEDYAIIKYFTLIKLGFDEKKLFLTRTQELYSGTYHMVLTYFKEKNESPLVLDNLSFRVLNLNTRKDIKADIFSNSQGVYKMGENNQLYKIAHSSKLYIKLIKKVQKDY